MLLLLIDRGSSLNYVNHWNLFDVWKFSGVTFGPFRYRARCV